MILGAAFWIVLVVSAIVFWRLPVRYRPAFLAVVSCGYLATLDSFSVGSFLAIALGVRWLAPRAGRARRGIAVALLVMGLVAYLAWFKYVPPALASLRGHDAAVRLVLPLGISYLTFKLVHYTLETARGTFPPTRLSDFLAYVFLFPTYSAGPIEGYGHFVSHRTDRFDLDLAAEGITRIAHGLIKKFVFVGIALESLSPGHGSATQVARLLAELPDRAVPAVWGFCALSFLTMYLDFSAYSDIAIGASLLFGIRIMENFDWPILAPDIRLFWSRWHMTLTGWCQAYVFMPVLGLTRRLTPAVFAGFLAIGVWHAGTWCWVSWGLYHATGVCAFHAWQSVRKRLVGPPAPSLFRRVSGTLMTLAFVTGSFALLAGDSAGGLADGLRILARLVGVDLRSRAAIP